MTSTNDASINSTPASSATSYVLVLNCGSSSLKFAVIDASTGEQPLSGMAERLGSDDAEIVFKQNGAKQSQALTPHTHKAALQALVTYLQGYPALVQSLTAIGHRVVHGGEHFREAILIDSLSQQRIADCSNLAPLHNPANLLGIEAAQEAFPQLPQVAVFDTAFHQEMPDYAYLYPLPYEYYRDLGVRRYGFHGTSCRYVTAEAARLLNKPAAGLNLIIAHLGNGASLTAVKNGHSVDTTMGLTPLEGVVHGTRCGSIDPGIIAYLAHRLNKSTDEIDAILWKKSGLLGLSGLSNDCRTIEEAAANGHEQAQLTLEIYAYRLAKAVGELMIPLGRLDALVFTGGIGENSSLIRARTLDWLGFLGLQLDSEANEQCIRGKAGKISQHGHAAAWVIPTNEELMIARDSVALAVAAQGEQA
ncbi:acetate kinase [Pokkaliibacter plantistimulans]|uniref:Acetate kinase n=1 Tax=Proteobacteria bacterium 228 TaxID=2083153 RepID=A0A2S5KX53_9PROT|nr:acetate kinase [Pokkaliibacter plantistimulans]PPC79285.1 acetate kinase [Pokkaliibacter plantistimulans]